MNNYIDYDFYKESYGGTSVPQNSFLRYSMQASAYIDKITFNRIPKKYDIDVQSEGYNLPNEIKFTVCTAMEKIYKFEVDNDGNGVISSETTGNHSVSYVTNSSKEKEILDATRLYLPSELTYRGIIKGVDTNEN